MDFVKKMRSSNDRSLKSKNPRTLEAHGIKIPKKERIGSQLYAPTDKISKKSFRLVKRIQKDYVPPNIVTSTRDSKSRYILEGQNKSP